MHVRFLSNQNSSILDISSNIFLLFFVDIKAHDSNIKSQQELGIKNVKDVIKGQQLFKLILFLRSNLQSSSSFFQLEERCVLLCMSSSGYKGCNRKPVHNVRK